jgi:hypothetical protein
VKATLARYSAGTLVALVFFGFTSAFTSPNKGSKVRAVSRSTARGPGSNLVIAEHLAGSLLSERLTTSSGEDREKVRLGFDVNNQKQAFLPMHTDCAWPRGSRLARACTPDTWTDTSIIEAPHEREEHTAVWTGSAMIIWGGRFGCCNYLNTGGTYNLSSGSWIATSVTNAPNPRIRHTAIWTGSEMIVWGGINGTGALNGGGRYNPITDSWTLTSTVNAPSPRSLHTAVWTGSEMIIWGGTGDTTGGRYDPISDSWIPTSTVNAPSPRSGDTAVWTGSEMIVWGGGSDTGGRYNPTTDTWTATSITKAPSARSGHTAVWTGSEMIVWGGTDNSNELSTGGRYNAGDDSWTGTNDTNAPEARTAHTTIWTGAEMIVWGGDACAGVSNCYLASGGRYDPADDSWTATSTDNAPSPRYTHTAVWTGSDMVIWGGYSPGGVVNSGGNYCAQAGEPTPTPTPCIGRCRPTPRPPPTPAPRP